MFSNSMSFKARRGLSIAFLLVTGSAFAASAPPAAPSLSPATKNLIAEKCSLCHGPEGANSSPVYPRLAAQHRAYLVKQLGDFRDGRRKGTMNEMAAGLPDATIEELASFFSSQKSPARRVSDADMAAVGKFIFLRGNMFSKVPACASCHGEKAHGTDKLPRLAGQNPVYLESQLQDFSKGARANDASVMHTVASKMTELEMRAVATYLTGLE